jgi:very-short-patch-repair endonuclease
MHAIPDLPCQQCPWHLGSPRFVWSVERFNDLRLERLTSKRAKTVPSCLCSFASNNDAFEISELPRVEMRPASTCVNDTFFPSFEAMADANGAGLYHWTAQLTTGDLVVHFLCGVAVAVLEVTGVRHGIVQASDKNLTYRFNALGYEMKCTSDSRILPATRATLERFVLQPDASESHRFL